MIRLLVACLAVSVGLWVAFAAVLLGWRPGWLPGALLALSRPASMADLGQAFASLEGLVSSLALMLGLAAVLLQVRHSTAANVIGALTARQQFLLAEYERLDRQIKEHKAGHWGKPTYDEALVKNMASKCKQHLKESKETDEKIKQLLASI